MTFDKDNLRIAMLSAHSCPVGALGARDTGGMSVYIRELARELGKQGHSVDVYTRVHDPADPISEDLGERARLIHIKAGEEESIHKLAVYSYLPEFACHLEGYRKNHGLRYDVVFSHYWLSGLAGRQLTLWWQVPQVVMFHTLGAVKNDIGIGEDSPELRIVTERETIQDCRRVIAATARERQELVRHYDADPEKIGIVPCGVNMELFRPVPVAAARRELGLGSEKVLLFVGRIDPLKGIDRLLQAVSLLPDHEALRLVIIGGDENSRSEVDRLRGLAAGLGIAGSVTFQGLVKHERLPYYYSAADVCVVPSYHESFGLVGLESLACGTPVVASDVGDLRNIIRQGETGFVVPENTPAYLAGAIALFLSGGPRDAEFARIMRASVSRFAWSNVAAEIAGQLRLALEHEVAGIK
jgi:D-inositol-3-phosphate glycosyltransferase